MENVESRSPQKEVSGEAAKPKQVPAGPSPAEQQQAREKLEAVAEASQVNDKAEAERLRANIGLRQNESTQPARPAQEAPFVYRQPKNAFEALGISSNASEDEIKQAYRRMAMAHHPDRTSGDKQHELAFKAADIAYNMLKTEEGRRAARQGPQQPRPESRQDAPRATQGSTVEQGERGGNFWSNLANQLERNREKQQAGTWQNQKNPEPALQKKAEREKQFCSNCGAELPSFGSASFCPDCGNKIGKK